MDITESESFVYKSDIRKKYTRNKNLMTNIDSDTYKIYKNELKYIKHRGILLNNVVNSLPYDMDSLEYRFNECTESNNKLLDLSHLGLTDLPNIPPQIKYLFINNNLFNKNLNLSHLKNLKILDCSNNSLTSLPTLPEFLEEILCRNNSIDNIDVITKYNIKRLDCSYNKINKIPIIDSLEILYCSHNNIVHIPCMNNLKKLDCRSNMISIIESMKNLELLECDKNKLSSIKDFPTLKYLFCNNNIITNLENLDSVEIIHCVKNNINKLKFFYKLKELMCDAQLEVISIRYQLSHIEEKKNIKVFYFKSSSA